MNPFAGINYMTVQAWSELDWRMVYEGWKAVGFRWS
jgi:hypothetical protein